jgi:hypothetical protein
LDHADQLQVQLDEASQLRVGHLQFPETIKVPHYAYDVDYITTSDSYNVALLRLAREVEWTSEVSPICLPPNASSNVLTSAGWLWDDLAQISGATIVEDEKCIRKPGFRDKGPFLQEGSVCAQNSMNLRGHGPPGGAVTADVNGKTYLVGLIDGPGEATSFNRTFSFVPTHTFYDWVMEKQLPAPKVTHCHDGQRKTNAGFCLTDDQKNELEYTSFMDAGDFNAIECQKGQLGLGSMVSGPTEASQMG